jgi:nicotinate-nucleotide adenylyltransferase
MTELAVACDDRLSADDRELNREGISYTIDTLRSFRQELGSETPLIFVMGSDAWPTLPTWESWQYLTDYAHLLILERPGDQGRGPAVLTDWAAGMWTEDIEALKERPCGLICRVSLVQVDVSATEIRRRLKDGESVTGLLPDVVHRYIVSEQLYLAS